MRYLCEAWYFSHKRGNTVQNFVKTKSFCGIPWTLVNYREIVFPTFFHFHKSCRNSANIRQHLTVFPSDFNNIYLKYFDILQNLTWDFTKATIFHSIFLVKSLTFVLFHPIMKYYWHFVISYHDTQNSSVCYCTISPLGNISKYFATSKQKVIFSILQILNYNYCNMYMLTHNLCKPCFEYLNIFRYLH